MTVSCVTLTANKCTTFKLLSMLSRILTLCIYILTIFYMLTSLSIYSNSDDLDIIGLQDPQNAKSFNLPILVLNHILYFLFIVNVMTLALTLNAGLSKCKLLRGTYILVLNLCIKFYPNQITKGQYTNESHCLFITKVILTLGVEC